MTKQQILSYAGSMQQLASVRPLICRDGPARGLVQYLVKNGPLQFEVMADNCMDIASLSYKGIGMGFLSKGGLQGGPAGGIMGGFLFSSGFENICAPCTTESGSFPLHGSIRSLPADGLSAAAAWEGDEYLISVGERYGQPGSLGKTLS